MVDCLAVPLFCFTGEMIYLCGKYTVWENGWLNISVLDTRDLLQKYLSAKVVGRLVSKLSAGGNRKFKLVNNAGSVTPLLIGAMRENRPGIRVVVLDDREEAAYFYNDLLTFSDKKKVAFLPSSYRRMLKEEEKDNDSVLVRTEVLSNIGNGVVDTLVTFPEALAERVVDKQVLGDMSMVLKRGMPCQFRLLRACW